MTAAVPADSLSLAAEVESLSRVSAISDETAETEEGWGGRGGVDIVRAKERVVVALALAVGMENEKWLTSEGRREREREQQRRATEFL